MDGTYYVRLLYFTEKKNGWHLLRSMALITFSTYYVQSFERHLNFDRIKLDVYKACLAKKERFGLRKDSLQVDTRLLSEVCQFVALRLDAN